MGIRWQKIKRNGIFFQWRRIWIWAKKICLVLITFTVEKFARTKARAMDVSFRIVETFSFRWIGSFTPPFVVDSINTSITAQKRVTRQRNKGTNRIEGTVNLLFVRIESIASYYHQQRHIHLGREEKNWASMAAPLAFSEALNVSYFLISRLLVLRSIFGASTGCT
jgi:hypothetical protein